jgi:branched-chain amino acid transport system permease protein/urea transport system permease protein
MVIAPLLAAVVGLVTEVALIRRTYDRPLDSLLLTFGIALVIRQGITAMFSNAPRRIDDPLTGTVVWGDIVLSRWRILLIVLVVILVVALKYMTERSSVGVRIQATVGNYELANSLGIDGAKVRTLVFVFGSALAGLAGALLAPLVTLDPQFGVLFLVNALVAVILGRLGSLSGLALAGLGIGVTTTLLQLTVSAAAAQILVLVLAMVFIRIRLSVRT